MQVLTARPPKQAERAEIGAAPLAPTGSQGGGADQDNTRQFEQLRTSAQVGARDPPTPPPCSVRRRPQPASGTAAGGGQDRACVTSAATPACPPVTPRSWRGSRPGPPAGQPTSSRPAAPAPPAGGRCARPGSAARRPARRQPRRRPARTPAAGSMRPAPGPAPPAAPSPG